eukprot:TRINITY_DN12602_c0_g1_i1.p1 TRINITY_DN12602_c0_g1~~TRINITY_DN12602_c0_g1_i1.p1  ORF type:complete len:356 (+),score=145.48 TRINITY_DN12602_c0_g1_i1:94-1161(+)
MGCRHSADKAEPERAALTEEQIKERGAARLQHYKESQNGRGNGPAGSQTLLAGGAKRFEKIKDLGRGKFSEVWKAKDTHTGRAVAVKQINKEIFYEDGGVGFVRFEREVVVMRGLTHPNLVSLYGMVDVPAKNEVWLIVEYCPGGTLQDVITVRRRVSEATGRAYLRQLLRGVDHLHKQQIVHRDLKPANILVKTPPPETHKRVEEGSETIKIADFGFANFQESDTSGHIRTGNSLKTCCGTPYYVAPEVISAGGREGRRGYSGFTCDVWSLGVILYEMLYGSPPFDGVNLQQLLHRVSTASYRFLKVPNAPGAAAEAAIEALLVAKPSQRATIEEVARAPWVAQGGWSLLPAAE